MECTEVTTEDHELVEAATAVIKKNFLYGKHHVGAAVRAKSGKIYVGVHLESQRVDVCAEHVAMGAAVTNGERGFDSIVAVQNRDVPTPTVISPCRTCQELISFYGDEIRVIVLRGGIPKSCRIKDLMV
ncbi:MAG: cytidine deaminase [bacterium]